MELKRNGIANGPHHIANPKARKIYRIEIVLNGSKRWWFSLPNRKRWSYIFLLLLFFWLTKKFRSFYSNDVRVRNRNLTSFFFIFCSFCVYLPRVWQGKFFGSQFFFLFLSVNCVECCSVQPLRMEYGKRCSWSVWSLCKIIRLWLAPIRS